MATIEELEVIIQSLQSTVTGLKSRILELEDFAETHIGLDWGTSGLSVNSSHPNISADTIESGGGIIRQDINGMQVVGTLAAQNAVYFVSALSADPDSLSDYASLAGYINGAESQIALTALSGGGVGVASLTVTADSSTPTGHVRVSSAPFRLGVSASDYGTLDDDDGNMQYRSDTDKFRGRVNGATDNFAMESWVTASFVAGTGSETDYAHSLMLMGA